MLKQKIKEKVKDTSEKTFMVLEDYPLITLMSLVPIVLPYPIVCNASLVFFLLHFSTPLQHIIIPKLLEGVFKEEFITECLTHLLYQNKSKSIKIDKYDSTTSP